MKTENKCWGNQFLRNQNLFIKEIVKYITSEGNIILEEKIKTIKKQQQGNSFRDFQKIANNLK